MTLSISFDSSVSLYGTIFALGQILINTRKKERSEQKNKRPQINRIYVEVLFGTMRGLDSTRLDWFERPRFRIRCDVALRWIRATRACSVDCEAALCRDSCLFFNFIITHFFVCFDFIFQSNTIVYVCCFISLLRSPSLLLTFYISIITANQFRFSL